MKKPIYIQVYAHVRYWEDGTVNGVEDIDGDLIPFREGGNWAPLIRLADGKIMNWPEGTTADVHYKVCDRGSYLLLDDEFACVAKQEQEYVPSKFLCHGGKGYGDYIILKINEHGSIQSYTQPEIDMDDWERA